MIKKLPRFFILILLTLFFFSFSEKVSAQTSTLHFVVGDSAGNNVPKCNSTPANCLKNEFNIVVTGNVYQSYLLDLYELFAEVSKSSTYQKLLKNSGPTIVYFDTGPVNCAARVRSLGNGHSSMELSNFNPSICSRTTRKDRLTHESGHVIRNGNMRLFQKYESQAYFPKDGNCFKRELGFIPPYFIKTYDTGYARLLGATISGSNESMADSMALYLDPRSPLTSFRSQCPVGYNWVKSNIFGNYVY